MDKPNWRHPWWSWRSPVSLSKHSSRASGAGMSHNPRFNSEACPSRRRHEAHLSAKQPTQTSQARLSSPHEHSCRPCHLEEPSGQGPPQTQRLIGRIQSRSVFQRIRTEGRHVRSGPLSCTMMLDSSLSAPQVGYALSRGYGSAVRRNRLRRQLRELVKARESAMAPGVYVFGASPRAHGTPFLELGRHVDGLLAKLSAGGTQ